MWFRRLWNWFMGGIQKSLEMWCREALGFCKLSFFGNSGGSSDDQNASRNVRIKGRLMGFQMGMRTLLGTGLEAVCVILCKEFSTFCLCPETSNRLNLKVMG
jgi:hypothetical protein